MKLATAISMLAVLAACSGSEPAPARPGADARPGAKPAAPSAPGCIDEFVQEYVEEAQDPPRQVPEGMCFAKDSPFEGPPRFPATSRKVRIEYERGDYFVTQESASWTFDESDTARGCLVAKLVRTKVVAISDGGRKESVRIEGSRTQRSSETGDQYRSTIALGSGFSDQGVVPGYQISSESTSFGRDCTRATQDGAKTSTCSFVQPHTCRSVRVMLPAESRTPNATNGVQVGRTTSFTTGAVDKSSWVLP